MDTIPHGCDPTGCALTAEIIAKALGGRKAGSAWMARCPVHDDHEPSLSIRDGLDGEPLFYCFAGCDWRDIKRVLRAKGLLPERGDRIWSPSGCRRSTASDTAKPRAIGADTRIDTDQQQRAEFARRKWREAVAIPGSLAEVYLRERGLKPGPEGWPPSLRFHAALKHSPTANFLPALVAAVTVWPGRNVTAIHRCFLREDGRKKAPISQVKMTLGPLGAGAVRLAAVQPATGLAEGVETALSAMQLFAIPVWAALGSRLDRVELPEDVIEVHIFGDNGGPGHEAAEKAAEAFLDQGRRVVVRFPPEQFGDWNDALRAEAAA